MGSTEESVEKAALLDCSSMGSTEESVEKATLLEEISKVEKLCVGTERGFAALQMENENDDVSILYWKNQLKEHQDQSLRLQTRLQMLDRPASVEMQHETLSATAERSVYVIHAHEDAGEVSAVMAGLEARGLRVRHPERDYDAGKDIAQNIEVWVGRSSRVLAFFSATALRSPWVEKEVLATLDSQLKRRQHLLIPVLLDVGKKDLPLYLQDKHFIDTRVEPYSSDKAALLERVVREVMAEDTPHVPEVQVGDMAAGLAWTYYSSHLKLVLPDVRERLMQSQCWREEGAVKGNMSTRLFILLPDSCHCHDTLEAVDRRIRSVASPGCPREGSTAPDVTGRTGVPGPEYRQPLYRVTLDDGQTYLIAAEFATPLLSVFEMEQEGWGSLKAADRLFLKKKFEATLREILRHFRLQQHVHLISYDDTRGRHKAPSASVVDLLVQSMTDAVACRTSNTAGIP